MYYNNNEGVVHGKRLEDLLLNIAFNKEGWSFATETQDLYEGTDFFFRGQRFDLATNCGWRKSNIWHEKYVQYTLKNGQRILLAVRTGNRHSQFKEPVVVLEFDEFCVEAEAYRTLECLVAEMPQILFKSKIDLLQDFEKEQRIFKKGENCSQKAGNISARREQSFSKQRSNIPLRNIAS